MECDTNYVASETKINPNKRIFRYKEGFEFVTSNLFIIGAYLIGYHQYSYFYLIFPISYNTFFYSLPTLISYCNHKRSIRTDRKRNLTVQKENSPETAEWVNQFLVQFWPLLDDIAKSWMIKKLHKIGLKVLRNDKHRFKINNATWGSIPPRIDDIVIKNTSTDNYENILHIDVDLSHESDSTIELCYSSITTTIRKIDWKGILRIVLYPFSSYDCNFGFEAMEISFIDTPDVNFEIGGLASVLTSFGLVDAPHIVSNFLGNTKFVLKFIQQPNKKDLSPFVELRKKSGKMKYGVQNLIQNTSEVILDTTEVSAKYRREPSEVKQFKNKNDKFFKTMIKQSSNGTEKITVISPHLPPNYNNLQIRSGRIKLGIKYLLENEELNVVVYEADGLERLPCTDPPDAQVILTLGKHVKEVCLCRN